MLGSGHVRGEHRGSARGRDADLVHRRAVHDGIDAVHPAVQRAAIGEIAGEQVDAGARERLCARGVADQRAHLIAASEQLHGHGAGDESGRAGDEDLHSAIRADFASARRRRSATAISKTASGSPAAAQTFSKRDMSSSITVSHGVSCANGGTPPIA